MKGLKAGDKVVVLKGAWKWMQPYGWSVVSKNQSFTIDGRLGVLISTGKHFCEVELEGVVNTVDVPKEFISLINAKNAKEDSTCVQTDNRRTLLRAVEHYGAKNQAAQCMGEMGELAAVLTQHFFQGRDRIKEIAGEIADVKIMLEQMILHLGIEKKVA